MKDKEEILNTKFIDVVNAIDAATDGNQDLAEELLKAAADVNAKDKDGETALMWAVYHKRVDVVLMLIEAKADVNARDKNGGTPLMLATFHGCKEIVEMLLAAGADVNTKDKDGDSALIYALSNEYKEIVEMLLKSGADVNAKDTDRATDLLYAKKKCAENKDQIMKTMKAIINADITQDKLLRNGTTTLMVVIQFGTIEMVEFLIEAGADVNARDNDGYTALTLAAEYKNKEIVDLLKKHGAKE